MRRIAVTVLALALVAADEPRSDAAKKDTEALQGAWTMASVVVDGEPVPEDYARSGRLVVEGDRYTLTAGQQTGISTFTVDPSKSPKQIDQKFIEGPQKGQSIQGIYELDGDTYRVCRGMRPEGGRPTKLESTPGSGLILAVWKRSRPAEGAKEVAIRKDRERLKGTWRSVSYARDGRVVDPDQLKGVVAIFEADGVVTARAGDRIIVRAASTIDPTSSPRAIDLTFTEGDDKGRTSLGIYEIDGDTFRLCRATPGQPRPSAFASEPGSGLALMSYRRDAADAKEEAIRAELKRFEGTWRFVSMEVGGKAAPEEALQSKLVIKGDQFTVPTPMGDMRGIFKVDPTVSPKTLDVTFTEGANEGKVHLGIYELEGDTYKVCMAHPGKPRPTRFVSLPDSDDVLEVLKREKR
jgi:uncharacterized protein (TIGR03067 family)